MTNHFYDTFKHFGTNVYCISDTHFGDEQLYRIRFPEKFIDLEENSKEALKVVLELDLWQVKLINKTCGKNSTLIHLGDVGDTSYIQLLKPKYKILLLGNHDKGASNYKKAKIKSCPECGSLNLTRDFSDILNHCYTCSDCHGRFDDNYFKKVFNNLFDEVYEGPLMINDKIILSHEPIEIPKYLFNIHGHIHSTQYKEDENHLNCCEEAINYIPINLNNLIKNGLLKGIKSIHRNAIDKNLLLKNKKNC